MSKKTLLLITCFVILLVGCGSSQSTDRSTRFPTEEFEITKVEFDTIEVVLTDTGKQGNITIMLSGGTDVVITVPEMGSKGNLFSVVLPVEMMESGEWYEIVSPWYIRSFEKESAPSMEWVRENARFEHEESSYRLVVYAMPPGGKLIRLLEMKECVENPTQLFIVNGKTYCVSSDPKDVYEDNYIIKDCGILECFEEILTEGLVYYTPFLDSFIFIEFPADLLERTYIDLLNTYEISFSAKIWKMNSD